MLSARVIVALTLIDDGLYRTTKFSKPSYVGDPLNAIRIFNDKEVDELVILDITPDRSRLQAKIPFLERMASQSFTPTAYGGAISSVDEMDLYFSCGFDKAIVNTAATLQPDLLSKAASKYGSQSIAASIDYRHGLLGRKRVCGNLGRDKTSLSPVEQAKVCEDSGAGEILLRSIDHDGLMVGYDLETLTEVAENVSIPVVAVGGAGTVSHFAEALGAGAHSVCAGSMFVYHGKHKAVLINYPSNHELNEALGQREWAG